MKITIVGTGYVGLVTGTCFAETGIAVTCVDIDETKINDLKKGVVPIYEPGLDALIRRNVEKQRLFFSTSLRDCLDNTEVLFIAVGTPPGEDGSGPADPEVRGGRGGRRHRPPVLRHGQLLPRLGPTDRAVQQQAGGRTFVTGFRTMAWTPASMVRVGTQATLAAAAPDRSRCESAHPHPAGSHR